MSLGQREKPRTKGHKPDHSHRWRRPSALCTFCTTLCTADLVSEPVHCFRDFSPLQKHTQSKSVQSLLEHRASRGRPARCLPALKRAALLLCLRVSRGLGASTPSIGHRSTCEVSGAGRGARGTWLKTGTQGPAGFPGASVLTGTPQSGVDLAPSGFHAHLKFLFTAREQRGVCTEGRGGCAARRAL